ncbi:DNA polymerase III catalytic subunit DnaE type [Scopulibacillus darangshiensis]|uniref:DNA-directed DNA polymerase n=1 Tax=Scopulibacillus darangshiensis TaxID=442528 RepID=A0A4R2PCJ9_9BACL|nr:DNA polymerase III subunit alpha [Scopulibacillus darangshiensis]TCP32084.1 DNA polymerase III catalytic subunit DnaE type [Scopulibacillus darangshiensis]
MGFVHLHVHSEYSLLNSACRIQELVNKAKRLGYRSLALTDQNALYGAVPFYKACKAAGLHPVIGMEVYMAFEGGDKQPRHEEPADHSLILLAKNQEGYTNLVKISSLVQLKRNKRLSLNELQRHAGGLFALSSGQYGDIETALLGEKKQAAAERAALYKKMFNGRFFLELQNHGLANEKDVQLDLLEISRKFGIPLVASNDVHYIEKEDALAYECLTCIKTGTKLEEKEQAGFNKEFYLKTPQEMADIFKAYPDAVANSEKIATACHVSFSFDEHILPCFPTPSVKSAKDFLREQCEKGLQNRYQEITNRARKRLDHELTVIDQMGFNDYFLIVWDVIAYARKNGIFPGPGRGSSAGSLVAYTLEITDVDPLKHDLLFERFLNPERVTMPDIDIDFPDKDRDEMIAYVCRKYGRDHVAQIITFGTLAAKAAIRDTGKVLGTPSALVDKLAKLIPSRPGVTLEQASLETPRLEQLLKDSDELRKLFQLAKTIEGVPRHTSIHAAGVVISANPLTELVPLQEGHDDIPLTQYPMDVLEALGLLKMDFLGLRNLTLIEDILDTIKEIDGLKPDLAQIPIDDRKTFSLLSKGDTMGIFQFESSGMRDVLKKLNASEFDDIVAVNALYRPGPMQFIKVYIDGKHGRRPVSYLHQDLEPILKSTYGVIVYQEQIMQIAAKLAGFTLGQADILRRAVSKKKRKALEEQRRFFVEGCVERGYSRDIAERIYQLIVRFADYGFPRSHAVAYSLIAYRLAYLKAHYPAAFMSALLSSVIHQQDKLLGAIHELKGKNLKLYPPSINASVPKFKLVNDGIVFGLNGVKNLGNAAVQEIVCAREKGPYKNLYDFCERVSLKKVNRRAMESLIFCGAMDEFGVNRAVLLASLDQAFKRAEENRARRAESQTTLLNDDVGTDVYVDVPPFSLEEQIKFEKDILGLYLTKHPLDRYKKVLGNRSETIESVKRQLNNHVVKLGVLVDEAKQIKTKKGHLMAFLTLSDQTGQMDAVVFPREYEKQTVMFQQGRLLYVEAGIEQESQERKLLIRRAADLASVASAAKEIFYLKVDENHADPALLHKLKSLLHLHRGEHPVIIHYGQSGKTIQLPKDYAVKRDQQFIEAIKRLLGPENVIIKAND